MLIAQLLASFAAFCTYQHLHVLFSPRPAVLGPLESLQVLRGEEAWTGDDTLRNICLSSWKRGTLFIVRPVEMPAFSFYPLEAM